MVSIGRNIKVERAKRDWTLDDLSERSGVAVSQLSLIERDIAQPKLDTLRRLSTAFELPLSALIVDEPLAPPAAQQNNGKPDSIHSSQPLSAPQRDTDTAPPASGAPPQA